MARPRRFDQTEVIILAAELFGRVGYNATSVDDLVSVTGLQRGSIYKAFGSKRNVFVLALAHTLEHFSAGSSSDVDLLVVALKELAHQDAEVSDMCAHAIAGQHDYFVQIIGANLLSKVKD